MKKVLQKLETSNFISGIHNKLLVAESIRFLETTRITDGRIIDHICTTHRSKRELDYLDSFVKFNVAATGLYQFLYKLEDDDDGSLMVNVNIDDRILLVAYKNEKDKSYVSNITFHEFGLIPIHSTSINLDYNNKVHILLYNKKAGFPEINLN